MLDEADASKQSLNFGPAGQPPVTAAAASLPNSSFQLGCASGSSGSQTPINIEENLLHIANSDALKMINGQNSQVLFEDQG